MKFVHISYTDKGGAGIAVSRTHKRLQELGYESVLYLKAEYAGDRPASPTFKARVASLFKRGINKIRSRFDKYFGSPEKRAKREQVSSDVAKNIDKYCFYSTSELESISIDYILQDIEKGDVVILYWLGFKTLNTSNIEELYKKSPGKIFWYALDMAPITGGCHYFWECTGYQNECKNCPIFNYEERSVTYYQFLSKDKNLKRHPVHLLASSRIGLDIFQNAALRFKDYSVLPYAIDTAVFDIRKTEKKFPGLFTIFFNAQNISDTRKGWNYFVAAIRRLDELLNAAGIENVSLISVDAINHLPYFRDLGRIGLLDMGKHVTTENDLAQLYHSADIFVCTSVEDLSPLMVNEALLCGIPVIGFDNASNSEYITENMNGNLIMPLDTGAMAKALYRAISGEILYQSQENIRNSVIQLHEPSHWDKTFRNILLRGQ